MLLEVRELLVLLAILGCRVTLDLPALPDRQDRQGLLELQEALGIQDLLALLATQDLLEALE